MLNRALSLLILLFIASNSSAKEGLLGLLGADIGFGTFQSDAGVPEIVLNVLSFPAMVGYGFGAEDSVTIGPVITGDLQFVGQSTPSNTVGGVLVEAISGRGGAGIFLNTGPWMFSPSFDFLGYYAINKPNAGGYSVALTSLTGFTFRAGYFFSEHWGILTTFQTAGYAKALVNGGSIDISGDRVRTLMGRVGVAFSF